MLSVIMQSVITQEVIAPVFLHKGEAIYKKKKRIRPSNASQNFPPLNAALQLSEKI
jgi:hypothetical protein